jgi:hypothetical protein
MLQLQIAGGRQPPYPANYRGCRHENELQKRNTQRANNFTREKCSQTSLYQVSPLRRHSEVARSNKSYENPEGHRQLDRQQKSRVSQLLHDLNNQVSQFGLKKQTVNLSMTCCECLCNTAKYDRVQWCCFRRRQNSGHYQNCLKSYEAEWPLEFIGTSNS